MNETQAYLNLPEIYLTNLIIFDFKKVYDIENEIEENWIKEKKCSCVEKLKYGKVLNCEHINKEINEKTKEIRKRIKIKSSISLYRELLKIQRI